MATRPGFFDVEDRLKHLSDLGEELEAFSAAVVSSSCARRSMRRSPIRMEQRAAGRRSIR